MQLHPAKKRFAAQTLSSGPKLANTTRLHQSVKIVRIRVVELGEMRTISIEIT